MSKAGIQMRGIPYKGSSLAMTDLLAGRLDSMFDVIMTTLPQLRAGNLRTLAVTSAHRHPLVPDIPTVAESGYPGFETDVWFALFAPAGTAPEIIRKIAEDSRTVLEEPQRRKMLTDTGFEIVASKPSEFAKYVQAEAEKWRQVIVNAHIQME